MAYTPLSGSNQLGGSTADGQARASERGDVRSAKEIERESLMSLGYREAKSASERGRPNRGDVTQLLCYTHLEEIAHDVNAQGDRATFGDKPPL